MKYGDMAVGIVSGLLLVALLCLNVYELGRDHGKRQVAREMPTNAAKCRINADGSRLCWRRQESPVEGRELAWRRSTQARMGEVR